jgi:hypothetical protein
LGTSRSCLSRATEILENGVSLCQRIEGFRFSVDTVWAVSRMADRRPGFSKQLAMLQGQGSLAIGTLWAGTEWMPHPECFVRDLQIGAKALAEMGVPSQTAALRKTWFDQVSQILDAAEIKRIVLAGPSVPDTPIPVIDLVVNGDLGIRFTSPDAVTRRDAEKELSGVQVAIPLGEELWCPTDRLLQELQEWAEDAGMGLDFETWDGSDATVSPSGNGAGQRVISYKEAMQPDVHSRLCGVSASLLRAERILSMTSLLGLRSPTWIRELDALWKLHLEDLSGVYVGSGDRVKRQELRQSCDELAGRADRLASEAELDLAVSVDAGKGPDGIVPIVVFNTSAYARSDAVDVDIVYYGEIRATQFDRYEFYRLVDADGEVVPVEEIEGKQVETAEVRLRFVAREIPPLGYKTYYLVPKPQDPVAGQMMPIQAPGAMTPDFPEPTFAIADVEERISRPRRGLRVGRKFTVGPFILDVDDVTGHIDVIDRSRGLRLIEGLRVEAREDSLKSAPGHFDPTGRVHPHAVDRVDLVESGEVSAQLRISGVILSSPVDVRLRVYADLPIVDIQVDLSWRDALPGLVELCLPLGEGFDRGHYDVPFGTHPWDSGTGDVWAERWLTALSENVSLTVSADRARLFLADREVRSPLLLSSPDPASYAYNKVWMSYPDRVTYGFRVRLGDVEDVVGAGDILENLSCQCVYDRAAPRTRPTSASALSLVSDSIRVSSIRPVEGGVELRAYEVLGKEGKATFLSAGSEALKEVDLNGRVRGDAGSTLVFSAREIKSIKLETCE